MKTIYHDLNDVSRIYTELQFLLDDKLFHYSKEWEQADLVDRVKFLIKKCESLEREVTRGCVLSPKK